MSNFKLITRKEFEEYLRVKEFMKKKSFGEAELRMKLRDRRPACITLMIRSDD